MTAFGDELRRLREDVGLSQCTVATLSGLSKSYVGDLERGLIENPTVLTIMMLAQGLGRNVGEMLIYAAMADARDKVVVQGCTGIVKRKRYDKNGAAA